MAGTWQRLAHVELSSSGDVIDSGTFTAKDNLKVIVSGIGTGGTVNCNFTFNNDTGGNYAIRESVNGGSDSTNHTQSNTDNLTGTVTGNVYAVVDITNISNKEKLFISEGMEVASGAGNAPERKELVGKWTNTSSSITQIKANNGGSGSYDTGSYITVFGASDDIVTDEKQTLADATSDTTLVAGTSDITDLTWTQTVGSSTSDTFYVLKDTSNDLMDIKAAGNCGAESSPSIAYATLSEALGTAYWRMRFKLVFNTVTAESTGGKSFFTNFFIVDSGTSSSSVGSENGFGFKFIADAGSTQTQFYATTNGTDSGTSMSWTPASGNTIYVEISWEGGTATANFYSDSGYSNRVSSTTANATRSGTFSGLKFPQIALRQDNGGNGVMEIDMSNLEIINRVSTAPPGGTRYEETDTRKIYRFKASDTLEQLNGDGNRTVFTHGGNEAHYGIKINTGSDLIGKVISKVHFKLKQNENPSTENLVYVRLWRGSSFAHTFGTTDPDNIAIGTYTWYSFGTGGDFSTSSDGNATLQAGDRIVLSWDRGGAYNNTYIHMQYSNTSQYEGTSVALSQTASPTQESHWNGDNATRDVAFKLEGASGSGLGNKWVERGTA